MTRTPWPNLEKAQPVFCAVASISIIGLKKGIITRPFSTRSIVDRTREFLEATKEIWKTSGAPEPTSVQIHGSGIYLVWQFQNLDSSMNSDARMLIVNGAQKLLSELPKSIQDKWRSRSPERLRIGIVDGDAIAVNNSQRKEFYGRALQLADKTRSFGRPEGLVIAANFIDNHHQRVLIEEQKSMSVRHFRYYKHSDFKQFLVTEDVYHDSPWTCLAWPGFARGSPGCSKLSIGLNTRGITVITHEGLQGKIGSLEIWPKHKPNTRRADSFELIIDDYDSLLEIYDSGSAYLVEGRGENSENQSLALATATDTAGFYFKAIRCGLNALAWNKKIKLGNKEIKPLRQILESKNYKFGIYDNMGATLPVLLAAVHPDVHDVFADCGESHCNFLLDILEMIQSKEPQKPLFRKYSTIKSFAEALQIGQLVDVAIGGGAWLGNPMKTDNNQIDIGFPTTSEIKGFVWIEGAAIIQSDNKLPIEIKSFLQDVMLGNDYQNALMQAVPYGACPVNKYVIRENLQMFDKNGLRIDNGLDLTRKEMSLIFKSSGNELNEGIVVRRRPIYTLEWLETWKAIKQRFC